MNNEKIEPLKNNLKVVFDFQIFLLQEYGGISRYICNLAKKLSFLPAVQVRIFAPLHFNRNLQGLKEIPEFRCKIPFNNTKLFRPTRYISKFLSQKSIIKFKPDILHETYYSIENFATKGSKRVITVYDLIHERYPDLFERSHMTTEPKRLALQRADHIICISESTRRDVIEMLGVKAEKTSVVYLGIDDNFLQPLEVNTKGTMHKRPYLLYVGARGGYKNFGNFLIAFTQSERLKSDFDIICFGGGSLNSNELVISKKLGLRAGQLSQISGCDSVLFQLYKHAQALVYPSLYEGFGIPPLEAMVLGCPVICSFSSSLPEVVGDAAEKFDPLDKDAITSSIETVLYSPERRSILIKSGFERSKMFSWDKCAVETEIIYRKLA